jgi:hydroxymethylpyrimidine/phosphomethylpyrimidine kinase
MSDAPSAPKSGRPGGRTPTALTIAGSDSGGGAGIQADLKAFVRCGVHGTSAITAITAQNTVGVQAIQPLPPELVRAQIAAVVEDIGVDAVKIGMLANAEIAHAVAEAIEALPPGIPVVVDPVMVAESGGRLLAPEAERALVAEILPRATVATPNVPEARVLVGADERVRPRRLVREVLALGPLVAVLTGGHRREAVDLFVSRQNPDSIVSIPGERHPDGAAHGSGCTHSSLMAACLALGADPLTAARCARSLAGAAIGHGLRDLGSGAGPVDVIDLRSRREALDFALGRCHNPAG